MAHQQRFYDRLRELALFAGGGGGILAGRMLGWRCVCAVEIEPAAAGVLLARQNQGDLEPFPVWDDVRTFDGKPWQGIVEVVSGGFPCTDISCAGQRAGIDGEASGLWTEMARIIGEIRPRYAFIENAADLPIRGLERVLCDLAALGFDAQWGNFPASAVGAPHERMRTWLLAAHPDRARAGTALQRGEFDWHDGQRRKAEHELGHGDEFVADLDGQWQPQPSGIVPQVRGRFTDETQDFADALRYRLERLVQQGRLSAAEGEAIQAAAGYTGTRNWLPLDPQLRGVVHGLADRLDAAA